MTKIGIMGAMVQELEGLKAELTGMRCETRRGIDFYFGTLHGKDVVLVQCGIGKVNAAMTTTLLLEQGIEKLIFTGVAGGLESGLRVGDLVISTDLLQHDVDVTALGYELGLIPDEKLSWHSDPELRSLALSVAGQLEDRKAVMGRILSGDQFIASPEKVDYLRETFGGACAEMEGAAVAQVAVKFGVPFVVIRSLSDSADGGAKSDYNVWMPLVAQNAKAVVRGMLERM